jgi:hypothetical protein
MADEQVEVVEEVAAEPEVVEEVEMSVLDALKDVSFMELSGCWCVLASCERKCLTFWLSNVSLNRSSKRP